ncbi:acyl-CoA esterase [Neiella marina]|uniref:Acyl-CoA esterase n=1 Tax=Neiella marina TaxID=508461 RepID=A0A8J2U441_9GAMM|nr:alpha/beta fold hydrolase [Neiella marina]GGA73256.1 acyl-CoA esterase [Neiella marina]
MLHFKDSGSGPAVILIHGLFGDLNNLGNLARELLANNYRVIQLDTRNHGLSPTIAGMTYLQQADDLAELITTLELQSVSLVGHSMGGKIAMAYALANPQQVQQLVVADIAPVPYQSHHQQVIAGLKSLWQQPTSTRQQADQLLSDFVDDVGVRQFLLKNLSWRDGECHWKLRLEQVLAGYHDVIDWPSTEHSYSGPTLFIKGTESDYILAEHRPAIGRHFPNSKAKLISHAGHWLHAQKPGAFNRIVATFLSANG